VDNARERQGQLACIGGSGRWEEQPGLVQCYNRGSDGRSIQWECKAEMDNSLRFGQVEVVCEGFDHPGDPYILVGSCGLEYHLELTREGRERRDGSGGGWQEPRTNSHSAKTYYDTDHQRHPARRKGTLDPPLEKVKEWEGRAKEVKA